MREIYDDNGKLQVSANLLGFVCRKSGRGTTVAKMSGNTNASSLLVPVPSNIAYPIIALSLDADKAAGFVKSRTDGSREYASDAAVGTGFSYYIFDWSPTIPQALLDASVEKVWDENGRAVFCDMCFPMLATDILDASGRFQGLIVTRNGLKLAVGGMTFGGSRTAGNPACYRGGREVIDDGDCDYYRWTNNGYIAGGRISNSGQTATTSSIGWDVVPVQGSSPPPNWIIPVTMLVVDVTDIPVPYEGF